MKRYWHELTLDEQRAILDMRDPERATMLGLPEGLTVFEFLEQYNQPDWCEYPNALAGVMGCWSLMSVGNKKVISVENDCGDCECRKVKSEIV